MNQDCEWLFEEAGWNSVYQKHKFKIWLTGCFREWEEEGLESFLELYNEEEAEEMLFDDFIFQYQMFAGGYKMNMNRENLNEELN